MTKPDDPASSAPRPRSPLPGLPKRTAAEEKPAPERPAQAKPATSGLAVPGTKNDATMVMSPPPPAAAGTPTRAATAPVTAPAAAPPRATPPPGARTSPPSPPPGAPAPAAAAPAPPPRRAHSDTLTDALNEVVLEIQADAPAADDSDPVPTKAYAPAHGTSTAEDLAAVRSVFNDVAVNHVAQVRDVMLELRYGDADPKWIELTKPALRSLRAMAGQMELTDLCDALDQFCVAVDAAIENRAKITDEDKAELLRRYARLIELIPQAFELDAERDRREPIIVESLLYQVEGVERPTIDKLFAVGLNRLDALLQANAGDVAAVTGMRLELAAAIVEQFKAYRTTAKSTVSAPDPHAERRELADLLIMLSLQHDEFTRASTEWTDDGQKRKRQLRKDREQTFQQIKVALARLGERDQLQRLEKLPFQERIASIDRYLSSQQPARPTT